MAKKVLGYIMSSTILGEDEKLFLKLAKEKNIDLVFFNLEKDTDKKDIKEKARRCDLVFNSVAEEFALEMAKTIECLGTKVIDSPKAYYYSEDKWMFYLNAKKHSVPVPETILLSENTNMALAELNKFNKWPVVLKRVEGCQGEFVARAANADEAKNIIYSFLEKENEAKPIIAQEFIKSHSYRVLTIGGKIIQCVKKKCHGWKAVGAWASSHRKFEPDVSLKKIVKKINGFSGINICGIDLVKKNNEWRVLEINSQPTFGFIEYDKKRLVGEALDFFKKFK
ncbi:MAG: ATP-grasp domain-containing protein [Candidatus Diapherotrites archaeon]|nr:ATP-grasp domain-containing protein [Candidatus Diapherotrites archaeon]